MKTKLLLFLLLMSTSLFAQKSILFLGDSYTAGTGVEMEDSYPQLLMDLLKQKGKSYSSSTIARGGWTSDELLNALPAFDKPLFDKVIVLIGTNNQFRNYNTDTYLQDLEKLIQQTLPACKNGLNSIAFLTTPDYSLSPYAKQFPEENSEKIAAWNKLLKDFLKEKNIAFVDIEKVSKLSENKADMFAEDRLHFSRKMYLLWAQEIVVQVKF